MEAPGRAVIEQAKGGRHLDEVEDLIVPDDSRPLRRPSRRSPALGRVPTVVAPGDPRVDRPVQAGVTRAKRVAETARLAARGERAQQWRPKG